jgi:predicted CXXCH cytochrome family protein
MFTNLAERRPEAGLRGAMCSANLQIRAAYYSKTVDDVMTKTIVRIVPVLLLPLAVIAQQVTPSPNGGARYVGSQTCKTCHPQIFARWQKTRMANVVRDPREHPDAILPDLSKPNPLLTFTKDDIALVYGSKWKQRYFKKVGDDYFPLPAQWDVTHQQWLAYFVRNGTDWWAPLYPPDNMKRPTGPLCDGCHSVNYNIQTKTVTEWNVGCERCHGPGSNHAARPSRANIVNPARLDYVHANDTCIQCHSQGQPLKNPIEGRYYDWAVGFQAGLNLKDYWKLEDHKLGEATFMHFPDGTAHKNRMQGNDFTTSVMYTRGIACFSCHDVHGTENNADLIKPASVMCLECHGPNSPNGPRTATIEQHTHHKAGGTGNECVACHMPQIEQTLGDVMVRSHTFRFITPSMTELYKIPNPCISCHMDKNNEWATEQLQQWPERSPWRMAN